MSRKQLKRQRKWIQGEATSEKILIKGLYGLMSDGSSDANFLIF